MRSAPLALLLLLPTGACGDTPGPGGPPPLPAAQELDPAVAALLEEHHARALAAPEEATALGEYGLALEANGLVREAAQAFARAAALAPAEPDWRYHEAVVRLAAGETAAARALLEQLAEQQPDAPWIHQRLGDLLLALGEPASARARFERVIALAESAREGGSEGHTGLGACELALGRPAEAARALERALSLDPTYKSAHYQLGLAYRELGRSAEAERELALGLLAQSRELPDPLAPELRRLTVGPAARLQLALQFLEAGRTERAVRMLEGLQKSAPEDVVVLNNLAIALQRTGELARAHELLTEAARLAPDVPTTWINLALLALDQNTSARALEHAERALALAPDSAKAHLARARVRLRQGKRAEALQDLEQCLRLDPRELEALALLGEERLARGEPEAARAAFTRLRAGRPEDARAALGLARVALAQDQRELAQRELASARRLGSDPAALAELERLLEAGR